jgi:hypothetical protein
VVFGQAWGRAPETTRSREAQVPLSSIGRRSRT